MDTTSAAAPGEWPEATPWRPPLEHILREVALAHGLARAAMVSASRRLALVRARWEFCYRAAAETDQSFYRIGRKIDRDHTTAIYAMEAHCVRHGLPLPRGMKFTRYRRQVCGGKG
jgi:hypothetical protein